MSLITTGPSYLPTLTHDVPLSRTPAQTQTHYTHTHTHTHTGPLRGYRVGVGGSVARRRRRPGELGHATREPEALGGRVVDEGGGVREDDGGRVGGEVVAPEGAGRGAARAVGGVVGGAGLPRDAVVAAEQRVDGGTDGAGRASVINSKAS